MPSLSAYYDHESALNKLISTSVFCRIQKAFPNNVITKAFFGWYCALTHPIKLEKGRVDHQEQPNGDLQEERGIGKNQHNLYQHLFFTTITKHG